MTTTVDWTDKPTTLADLFRMTPPKLTYWELLFPWERRSPSILRPLKRARWRNRHERIASLEEALHIAPNGWDQLPWTRVHYGW